MTETIPEGKPLPTRRGNWFVARLVSVWVLGLVLGTLVVLQVAPDRAASWHVLVIGVVLVVTFVVQLGSAQKPGFIARLAVSIAGGVLASLLPEVLRLVASFLPGIAFG